MPRFHLLALIAVLTMTGASLSANGKPAHPVRPHPAVHHPAGKPDRDARPHAAKTPEQHNQVIADQISRNPQLKARLEAMLPSGMTLAQASAGFRNQGQFIAALNASKHQGIPFADLKAAMTGDHPLSLGQAVQKLKPEPPKTGTTTTTTTKTETEKPENRKSE